MTSMEDLQRAVCKRYGSQVTPCLPDFKVGISRQNWRKRTIVNGLRHPVEGGTTGWYFWLGKDLSNADDFFAPLHVWHLTEYAPTIVKFLSLSPGWRFLIDESNGYEDVWYDKNLLRV